MIALLGASAIILLGASGDDQCADRSFSRSALRKPAPKRPRRRSRRTPIDAYSRNACSVQMRTLKSAVVAFRIKNGMAQKAAAEDANMTVDDYVATSVDKYQFMAQIECATSRLRNPRRRFRQHRRRRRNRQSRKGSSGDLTRGCDRAAAGPRPSAAIRCRRASDGLKPTSRSTRFQSTIDGARSAWRSRSASMPSPSRRPITNASSAASVGSSSASSTIPWPLRRTADRKFSGLRCRTVRMPSRRPCAPGPDPGIVAVAPVSEVVAAFLCRAGRGC